MQEGLRALSAVSPEHTDIMTPIGAHTCLQPSKGSGSLVSNMEEHSRLVRERLRSCLILKEGRTVIYGAPAVCQPPEEGVETQPLFPKPGACVSQVRAVLMISEKSEASPRGSLHLKRSLGRLGNSVG